MPFIYTRTVRFQDTDAAGVVYFANVLPMCHEAYEESLAASGINLKAFFSNPDVAIPIVHASVDFFRPMFCGDQLVIYLTSRQISGNEFSTTYSIFAALTTEQLLAKAITRNVCIAPVARTRKDLPDEMIQWLSRWGDLRQD